jgi:hypothetical protein
MRMLSLAESITYVGSTPAQSSNPTLTANDFAYQRNGIPLLNQSPFVERKHVEAAYGQRWLDFCKWVRIVDPTGRMLNPFFAELLPTTAQSGGT